MYNPQVTSTKNDIEQGRKDAYQSNTGNVVDHATVSPSVPAVNYPVVGVTFCCCDTRNASIGWFFVSILLELAALIMSFTGGGGNFVGIFISIFLLIFSIQGLRGSVLNSKNNVMAGFAGFILKAVLNLIGLIVIATSWKSILDQMDVDNDDASLNYGRTIFIIIGVVIVLFYSIGAVVVFEFMKEIEAGIFVPASEEES